MYANYHQSTKYRAAAVYARKRDIWFVYALNLYIYLLVAVQIVENDFFLRRLLVLAANAQAQTHHQLAHKSALERVPQELWCVTSDCLQ